MNMTLSPGAAGPALLELTSTQEAIYVEGRFFGDVVNNIGGCQKYFSELDVARFARARDLVLGNNDAYQMRFREQDGVCRAFLAAPAPAGLPVLDCSDEPDPAAWAHAWMQDQFETPFGDLAQQVFQDALLKLADDEYWYFAKAHHLIMDGWAFALQMRRVTDLYARLASGPVDAVGYPSYLAAQQRQREYADSQAWADDKAYWLERLAGVSPLPLPQRDDMTDDMTDAAAGSRRVSRQLPRSLFDALQALGQRLDANLVAVVQAVLYVYFARAYGADDLVIGMPVHNRRGASQKEVIGSLVNVNACPVRAARDEPFDALVRRLGQELRAHYRHSRFPMGELVRLLRERGAPAGGSHQVAFNYQKLDFGLTVDGKAVQTHYLTHHHERVAASFVMCEYGAAQDIALHLDYNLRYFDSETAAGVLERIHGLLEQAVAEPARPLDRFDLPTAAERRRQLVEWNDTAAPVDAACIDELVDRQAAATPQRVAVRAATGSLTYAGLREQSDRLAQHLIGMGVQPEQMVGVYMRRTPSMIVAMLAILKAGACYVPIDTSYPRARIDYILSDSAVALVLTDAVSAPELPTQAARIDVDGFLATPGTAPAARERGPRDPAQLAYVIYTSGSTGLPKGVLIEHRNAVALLDWAARVYTDAELQGVLAGTSICFDLSVFEIFVPLSRGGCVVLADNALALRDGVAGEVTLINTVPSAMRALLDANAVPPSVRCINLAGELLPQELVEAVHRACTVRLFDLYGPSEDTTYSTFALREPGGEGSIGRPIDNTRVYVLDEQGNLLPPGLTGELHIGGAGLARGYLNRPELTAERFVHNRHADERVYRTGDLVRYLSDGRLRYVGRKDHQVKIRGYRIEPGEIEAAIRRHAHVQACAVVTRHDAAGASLVAAVVAGPEASDGLLDEVQAMLGQHLPPYMVPGATVLVDALPLTANGKLDREALAALHTAPIPAGRAVLTETELRVVRLWQRVLGAANPGPSDSFFKLGGDSLRLLQLAVQLEAEFAIPIALPTLFTRVTVASQAQWIEQQQDVRSLLSHVAAGSDARAEEYIDL